MTTIDQIKDDFKRELSSAKSEIEKKMIKAEYNYRIKKLENEGSEAYELAYVIPKEKSDDCGCGKD